MDLYYLAPVWNVLQANSKFGIINTNILKWNQNIKITENITKTRAIQEAQ